MAFQYEKRTYEPEVLKRLQQTELEILKDFASVCDKYKLPYFVVYGTAIGAVRHHGFIPWDDDTDVAMLRKDYDRFLEVVDQELGDKYKILTPEIDKNYAGSVTHLQRKGTKFVPEFSKDLKCDMCIDLDIFPLDHVAMDPKKAKIQELKALFWGKAYVQPQQEQKTGNVCKHKLLLLYPDIHLQPDSKHGADGTMRQPYNSP